MGPRILMLLLGCASLGKALVVTLEQGSKQEIHVRGMNSTYFSLKTCGAVAMFFRGGFEAYPYYQITVNYVFEGGTYTVIGLTENADTDGKTVAYSSVSFPICTYPGTFWVSWGRGALKFGEGYVVDTNTTVEVGFDGQVENITIQSLDDLATWDFPELPETTTSTTTVSSTQVDTTLTTVTKTTTDSATTSNGGQGSSSNSSSSSGEQETVTMSKSFASENLTSWRIVGFVVLSCFATIKTSY